MREISFYTLAETAVTVEFDTVISLSANERVLAASRLLKRRPFIGFREAVPAFSTLTVYFDPLIIRRFNPYLTEPVSQFVTDQLKDLIVELSLIPTIDLPVTTIPVCYEADYALDIKMVAKHCGISSSKVIDIHSDNIYHVFFTGFVPGFPYLGISPEILDVPRKKIPDVSVAAGSVALAGRQSGIYPFTTPGGWQIIGRTPVKMYDKSSIPACQLSAGQKVRFAPVSIKEFKKLMHT